MKQHDWVLNAHCRECGISGTVQVSDDRHVTWPTIVHEADCALAESQDLTESARGQSVHARRSVYAS
jgi:hypothetical protein